MKYEELRERVIDIANKHHVFVFQRVFQKDLFYEVLFFNPNNERSREWSFDIRYTDEDDLIKLEHVIESEIQTDCCECLGYNSDEYCEGCDEYNKYVHKPQEKNTKYTEFDPESLKIKRVIFNDPATIVFWENGDKTVAKCRNEKFDPEKGLAIAIAKKVIGYAEIKKWIMKYEKEIEEAYSLLEDFMKKLGGKIE